MTHGLRIAEEPAAAVTILRLEGRLELDEGDTVFRDCVDRLAKAGRVTLILDMRQVTRLDSAGIGMLVAKYLTVLRKGGTMALLGLTGRCGRLMDVTQLTSIFPVFDDEQEALRSLGARSAS